MSEYVNEQAEESENEGYSSDNSEPVIKKSKISKRRNISSDEDDDEEEEGGEEMKNFVVDEVEEGEDDDKSEQSASDASDALDEDDVELVNENMGVRLGGRVEISDDEDDREQIQRNLFGYDGNDDERVPYEQHEQRSRSASVSSRESEDDDRFIVDDEGRDIRRRKHDRPARNQAELREAQDIFGFDDEDLMGTLNGFFDEYEDEEEYEGEGGDVPARKKKHDNTLLGVIEPDELKQHDAARKQITFEDIPERYQTRQIPVASADDAELAAEARWIQQRAFKSDDQVSLTVSKQEGFEYALDNADHDKEVILRDAPDKIRDVLNFIRNMKLEVPFIAFYRKEYINDILGLQDLWTIYEWDEKWMHLRDRKNRLMSLMRRMHDFIQELQDTPFIRQIVEKDYADLEGAQSAEEIMDCFDHFHLYYSNILTKMVQHEIEKIDDPENRPTTIPKMTPKNDKYWNCALNGPGAVTAFFGITAEQIAENFEYHRHFCRIEPRTPTEVAAEFINQYFTEPEKILQGAVYVLAFQLSREIAIRKRVRELFRTMAKLNVHPIKRGIYEIDENHPLYGRHYISGKPIQELENAEYLEYQLAKDNQLIHMEICIDPSTEFEKSPLVEAIIGENVIQTDEGATSESNDEWHKLRLEALEYCVDKILVPHFIRETHELLITEARQCALREARRSFERRIAAKKYTPALPYMLDDEVYEDLEANNVPVRIIGIAPPVEKDGETIAVALDANGCVVETCPLVFRNRFDPQPNNEGGNVSLRAFIQMCRSHKPHVIAIAGTDMRARGIKINIEKTLESNSDKLQQQPPVEIVSAEAARIYSKSRSAQLEFPTYSANILLAISAARTLLDPLVEYAHLWNSDNDYLGIRIHPLQDSLPQRSISWCFEREFINRVNEVGVDINHCIEFPHTSGVLKFICGLGPQKAAHVLQLLQHQNLLLDARAKLVTLCNLGPTVFVNAAGFIRIDVQKIRETAEEFVELLDGSRVHPETYEWARKMAIDALEYNEESSDPSRAIEEVMAAPDRLRDLDLDAFADELTRQGFGDKSITLYDIRAELNSQYKDLRQDYEPLVGEELFKQLVPNANAYTEGKLVQGRIQRLMYSHTKYDPAEERTHPKEFRGKHSCPDCRQLFDDRDYLIENHMGSDTECPGKFSKARVSLEDGIVGFISFKELSDDTKQMGDPAKFLRPGQNIVCRILQVDYEKMSCNLTCKGSQLREQTNNMMMDAYFDQDRETQDKEKLDKHKKKTNITTFTKRVISHPSFHNVSFPDAERMLKDMSQGEAIIRPSTASTSSLSVTWKVADGIYQHVKIEERRKKHVFDLGKELRINDEVFEDLNEILARHITPMAEFARDVLNHKYFLEGAVAEDTGAIEDSLRSQKEKQPGRLPYVFTPSKDLPGKFVLSYLLSRPRHEYFTVTPDGYRFRKLDFPSLDLMLTWFKGHYRQAPPQ